MARRRYPSDEGRIALFHKEGRGTGRGGDYKPWLTVQDVPSSGRVHRVRGLNSSQADCPFGSSARTWTTCWIWRLERLCS